MKRRSLSISNSLPLRSKRRKLVGVSPANQRCSLPIVDADLVDVPVQFSSDTGRSEIENAVGPVVDVGSLPSTSAIIGFSVSCGILDPLSNLGTHVQGESGWHQGIKKLKKGQQLADISESPSTAFLNCDELVAAEAKADSDDMIDEITSFQNGRWVGPPEAMWRIYKFLMNEVRPPVMTLQLHLENNQKILCAYMVLVNKLLSKWLSKISLLSLNQWAFDIIFERYLSGGHGSFFIDGPGGTGVAASILPGGRTAHSRFEIPLNTDDYLCCSVSKQSSLATLLRAAKIIIWDEATMICRQAIEAFERMLRDICECNLPFGGKIVVFGGDFRQTLPVIPKGSIEQMIEASLVKSPLWLILEKLRLTENMRAKLDPVFSKFLLGVGNGETLTIIDDQILLPSSMVIPYAGPESLKTLL